MSPAEQVVATLVDAIVDDPAALALLAAAVAPLVGLEAGVPDRWLDSRDAAEHVGETYDAFKKHMHEIPSEQAGAGCKRYFRRSDLDAWREGRRFHNASIGVA